jgi:hypothetical protein
MTSEAASAVRNILFGEARSRAFTVLDGASVPGLLDRLYRHDVESECLYRGELTPDLAHTAPYLVMLEPASRFTEWTIAEGWGRHWGIFGAARQDTSLATLRRHFRHFLKVSDPKGKPLYFRYYDPRVLRDFLPLARPDQLDLMFGSVIRAYFAEADPPTAVLKYEWQGGELNLSQKEIR